MKITTTKILKNIQTLLFSLLLPLFLISLTFPTSANTNNITITKLKPKYEKTNLPNNITNLDITQITNITGQLAGGWIKPAQSFNLIKIANNRYLAQVQNDGYKKGIYFEVANDYVMSLSAHYCQLSNCANRDLTPFDPSVPVALDDSYSGYRIKDMIIEFNDPNNTTNTSTNNTTATKGEKGERGIQGEKGEQGLSAYQVYKTISGNENKSLEEYLASLKGDKGEKGDKGDRGLQGERGLQGIQGETGSQGPKGDQGIKGDKGIQGLKGEQGIQGEKGLQGIQGEQGERGDTGLSAYQVYKTISGNENKSLEEYLSSLKGEKGEKGEQGIQGEKGLQGIQGLKGDKGDIGNTGATGAQGDSYFTKISTNVALTGTDNLAIGGNIKTTTGYIQTGQSNASCTSQLAGSIRFNQGKFEGCDGSSWQVLMTPSTTLSTIYPSSCKAIKDTNSNAKDGSYFINPNGMNTTRVYCDMTTDGGGWTLLLTAKGDSQVWGTESGKWIDSSYDSNYSLTTDYKSQAYNILTTNTIRLCYQDNNHCFNFDHHKNIPLRDFFTHGIVYTAYSYGMRTDKYPSNTGSSTIKDNYLQSIGVTAWSTACYWLGINDKWSISKIGLVGDGNYGCQSHQSGTDHYADDLAVGLGLHSCNDSNGCDAGGPTNIAGEGFGIDGTDVGNLTGLWFVYAR